MARTKGQKITKWTEEEHEVLVDHIKKHRDTSIKECQELAKYLNECIWEGRQVRTAKAVSLRAWIIRKGSFKPVREVTQTKTAEPKTELNMTELGESVYTYIGSLIEKCQKLGDAVADEQERFRQTVTNYKGIVKDRDDTIAQLNQTIINLNSKIHQNSGKTFKLSELMSTH